MKVGKSLVLYPLGQYKSVVIHVDECTDWKQANETLRIEYLRMREFLSEADQQKLDKLLK